MKTIGVPGELFCFGCNSVNVTAAPDHTGSTLR